MRAPQNAVEGHDEYSVVRGHAEPSVGVPIFVYRTQAVGVGAVPCSK